VEEIAKQRIMKRIREKGTILLGVLAIVASAVLLQASMPFENAMTSLQATRSLYEVEASHEVTTESTDRFNQQWCRVAEAEYVHIQIYIPVHLYKQVTRTITLES